MYRRLPDFLIIGGIHCGVPQLSEWLAAQPEIYIPVEEVDFFSNPRMWERGSEWYSSLFDEAAPAQLVGEASPSYMSPESSGAAAERIAKLMPGVRLVCILREPMERLRSHHRHELRSGRERQPVARAAHRESDYVRHSLYHEGLRPYLELFDRSQVLVLRFEDFVLSPDDPWRALIAHLKLPYRPTPFTSFRSGIDETFSRNMASPRDPNQMLRATAKKLPRPVKKVVRSLLDGVRQEKEKRAEALDGDVTETILAGGESLARLLGREGPLWEAAAPQHGWPDPSRRVDPPSDASFSIISRRGSEMADLYMRALRGPGHGPPDSSYLICTIPRTGSNFLSLVLSATGVAGYPIEFFLPQLRDHLQRQLGVPEDDYTLFVRRILVLATSPNKVFGAKLHSVHARRLLEHAGYGSRSIYQGLSEVFPAPKFVFLRREDRAAQAVSWWRALTSGQWVADLDDSQSPYYDFGAIGRLYDLIESGEQFWASVFAESGREPLTLVYEDVARAPDDAARRVLEFIGADSSAAVDLSNVRLRRQSDETSVAWKDRFVTELETARN